MERKSVTIIKSYRGYQVGSTYEFGGNEAAKIVASGYGKSVEKKTFSENKQTKITNPKTK